MLIFICYICCKCFLPVHLPFSLVFFYSVDILPFLLSIGFLELPRVYHSLDTYLSLKLFLYKNVYHFIKCFKYLRYPLKREGKGS